MIITVKTVEELRGPVNRCKAAASRESGNALQSCLLFEATTDGLTGRLSITAHDPKSHQMTLCLADGVVDVQEPGSALVPNDYIAELLNKLPNQQEVSLEIDTSNRMVVKCNPHQFEVFLHQGSVDDYKLSIVKEEDLPEPVCVIGGSSLSQLIGDSVSIISDQEEFKMLGEGVNLHAFSHDRGSNIVSHVAVEAGNQVRDWAVSTSARFVKLINKYWLDDVDVCLEEGNGAMIAFKCNHDYFLIRQLSTDVDVQILQDALAKEPVGAFVLDGQTLRSQSKLLDLAKGEVNIEVARNLLKFSSTYTSRGNNEVKMPTISIEGQQPREKFNRDLLKKAIGAMEVSMLEAQWVPLDEDATNHFLRFVDADVPEHRQIMITPVQ